MPVVLVVHFGIAEVGLAPLHHMFASVFPYLLLLYIWEGFLFPLKESVTATDKAVKRAENWKESLFGKSG